MVVTQGLVVQRGFATGVEIDTRAHVRALLLTPTTIASEPSRVCNFVLIAALR
jgi:hypothetical protein